SEELAKTPTEANRSETESLRLELATCKSDLAERRVYADTLAAQLANLRPPLPPLLDCKKVQSNCLMLLVVVLSSGTSGNRQHRKKKTKKHKRIWRDQLIQLELASALQDRLSACVDVAVAEAEASNTKAAKRNLAVSNVVHASSCSIADEQTNNSLIITVDVTDSGATSGAISDAISSSATSGGGTILDANSRADNEESELSRDKFELDKLKEEVESLRGKLESVTEDYEAKLARLQDDYEAEIQRIQEENDGGHDRSLMEALGALSLRFATAKEDEIEALEARHKSEVDTDEQKYAEEFDELESLIIIPNCEENAAENWRQINKRESELAQLRDVSASPRLNWKLNLQSQAVSAPPCWTRAHSSMPATHEPVISQETMAKLQATNQLCTHPSCSRLLPSLFRMRLEIGWLAEIQLAPDVVPPSW
uniref:Dynactin domain-containing protein n=1 Tax=Macrostomum lignano TaxID=282301 RepID=A0A1I8F7W1_9PLAT